MGGHPSVQCGQSQLASGSVLSNPLSQFLSLSLSLSTLHHYLAGCPPTDRQLLTAWETRQDANAALCQGAVNATAPGTPPVPPSAIEGPGKWAPSLQGPGVAAGLDLPWRAGCLGGQQRSRVAKWGREEQGPRGPEAALGCWAAYLPAGKQLPLSPTPLTAQLRGLLRALRPYSWAGGILPR